jgi:hypothetical protein
MKICGSCFFFLFEMECINVIMQLRVHCYFCIFVMCHFRRKRMCLVCKARTQERFANRLCASCCRLQRAVSPTFSPLHFTIMHSLSVLNECVRTAARHMKICARTRGPWEPSIWALKYYLRLCQDPFQVSVSTGCNLYIVSGSVQHDFAADRACW